MGLLQLFAQAGDGAAELALLILARPRMLLHQLGVLLAEALHFVAQFLHGALQLARVVMTGGNGGLHGFRFARFQSLQFITERGHRGAKLARFVLGSRHGGLDRLIPRSLHAFQLAPQRLDGAVEVTELPLGQQ
ncbi:MAG TPA: hypothetical protein PLQ52_10240 [Lacunisphaera sp.]|nr:hypothetical protein [Lacunisphaera sp.]